MDEILKRDENHVTVLAGVTDDVDKDIVMLRVDPITKRLLVKLDGGGSGVTSLNTLTGAVTLSAGSNITLTPSGNDIEISSTGGGGSGWSLTGNAGTTPGTDFIGTTDAQDLLFKTGGQTKLRLYYTGANQDAILESLGGISFDAQGVSGLQFSSSASMSFIAIDDFSISSGNPLGINSPYINLQQTYIRFSDGAGINTVNLKAPASISTSYTLNLPTSDSTGTQALVSNGSSTLSWASIPTLPVADYKLIPFMNASEDSYDFDRDFLYDPQIQRLEVYSNNENNDGALYLEIDTSTKIATFSNRELAYSTTYHIAEDFSFGVPATIGSFGSDATVGFHVKYTDDDTNWGQVLYQSVDQFVYNPRYYMYGDSTVYFGGDTSVIHITGNDKNGTPSVSLGTGAGTGATSSIEGTDMGMRITITTGTSPAANATVATITFATGYNFRPFVVASAGNVTAAARAAVMHFDAPNETTFTIKVGATALTASAGYVWNIHVIGREAV